MPIYKYVALNDQGDLVTGTLPAENRTSAKEAVSKSGLYVRKLARHGNLSFGKQGLSQVEQFRLIRSFRSLLTAGLSVTESLEALESEPENVKAHQFVSLLLNGVRNGKSMTEVAESNGYLFDHLLANAFRTGEKSGDLISALDAYVESLSQRIVLARDIKSALSYPAFLLAALAVVMVMLFVYVIPNFNEMFDSFGADLPMPTQIVMGVAENFYLIVFGGAISSISILSMWGASSRSEKFALWLDAAICKLPLIGYIRKKIQVARLSLMLKSLLSSGTPMVEAMELCQSAFQGTDIGRKIKKSRDDIVDGLGIHASFKRQNLFSGYSLRMLAVGERSSSLEDILEDISRFHKEELDDLLTRFTKIIEPALILIMGLLMGFVIISMYLPIFYMAEVVK